MSGPSSSASFSPGSSRGPAWHFTRSTVAQNNLPVVLRGRGQLSRRPFLPSAGFRAVKLCSRSVAGPRSLVGLLGRRRGARAHCAATVLMASPNPVSSPLSPGRLPLRWLWRILR